MAREKLFDKVKPAIPHLARPGGGISGEVWDLREDVKRVCNQLDTEIEDLQTAVSAAEGAYASPVQAVADLRAVLAADRLDKQVRLVEDKGSLYRFDTAGTGADDGDGTIVPDDVTPPDPGRWFKSQAATQDHEGLTGLQGGALNDHIHLSTTEYGYLPTADEKAALAGTGTPSATDLFLNDSDLSVVRMTKQNQTLWIDGTSGDDLNTGLTDLEPVQTWGRIHELVAQNIAHHLIIRVSGKATAVPYDLSFIRTLHQGKTLLITGDDTLVEVMAPTTATASSINWIEDGGLALTPNQYTGLMIEITGGALAGQMYTIGKHTATRFYPAAAGSWDSGSPKGTFTADPGLVTFRVVKPGTEIEVVCTPGAFEEQVSATYSVDGEGWFLIQRIEFTGNMPLNFSGGNGVGKTRTFMSCCVINKPQAVGFNFWDLAYFLQGGLFGVRNKSQDPTVYGHSTVIPGNHAGVGIAGGDGSQNYYSTIVEFSKGYFYCSGSKLNQLTFNAANGIGPNVNNGSYIGYLEIVESVLEAFVPVEQSFFGGLIISAFPFPVYPPAYVCNSVLSAKDCDFSGGLAHGIAALNSVIFLQGTITGTNGTFGALARGSHIYKDPLATITLAGALGDFSFDGAAPGGTWGGADVTDPNELSRVRTLAYANFGSI